jgi:xanthine dehydrogenase accessory factor
MLIFGAVDMAQALCRMARQVGFRTVVSDARTKFATPERLPDADDIVVGWLA